MSFVVTRPPNRGHAPALLLAVTLGGCTVGPDYHPPAAPADTRFTETQAPVQTVSATTAGGAAQRLSDGRDIPGAWWELFHSPQITSLVTQALKANPDVAAAQRTPVPNRGPFSRRPASTSRRSAKPCRWPRSGSPPADRRPSGFAPAP
jgi:hypothetical protein